MSEFIYHLQPTRAEMLCLGTTPAEDTILETHFAYLQTAIVQGVVLLAGQTLTTDASSFGIVILRAATEAEAMSFMQADPAVNAGVMQAELYPFRVALLAEGWGKI